MIIDDTKRILFIHIPKSAGDSIRHLLCNHGNSGKHFLGKHASYRMAEEELGNRIDFYAAVAIIRNPYDRILSFYHHLRKPLYLTSEEIKKSYPSYTGRLLPEWACEMAMNESFPDFIKGVYSEERKIYQRRWFNDSLDWITDGDGQIKAKTILRYEHLQSDLAKFCRGYGINGTLPFMGASSNPKTHLAYRSWYDEESMSTVKRIHRDTIDYFGYNF